MSTRMGKRTIALDAPPAIIGHGNVVGKKEGEGPLAQYFDHISGDSYFGESSWEKAERAMLRQAFDTALGKAGLKEADLDMVLAGDLLNQCISGSFALRDNGVPYLGLYGACSTMAESLILASLLIDTGAAAKAAAMTASHFCTAERQYRLPLDYGGQRTPTSQWTVTGAGAVILGKDGPGPYITHVTPGSIIDPGIRDANNMGAAMAPAAADTVLRHLDDVGGPEKYDLIVTGDLGSVGSELFCGLLRDEGLDISSLHFDCGAEIFDRETQDVHAGGSGCGCCAAVLTGRLLQGMKTGIWDRILFCATGALLSPLTTQQGESIPGVCHAVTISNTREMS